MAPESQSASLASGTVASIVRNLPSGVAHLAFWPHGYDAPICLPVITHGSRDAARAWTWNGSTEKPTLMPSVRTKHADGKVSHLWLTDGMCQHLADSTDGLAGQTLPLRCIPNLTGEARPTEEKDNG